MRRRMLQLFVVCGLCACSHDLDKLTAGRSNVIIHKSDGGKDAGHVSLAPDAGMPDSGPTTGTPSACEPCDPVNDAGAALGLRNCCRGIGSRECGLTFADGTLCLAHKVPGQDDSACNAVRQGANQFEGCCRPDGRCGVRGDMYDLGCVARDEILPQLGAARTDVVPCQFECEEDTDCTGVANKFVCAEDPADSTHAHRICMKDCSRDQDCVKGQVCSLQNDLAKDRVQSICQAPIGAGDTGDFCSSPHDCAHGVCLMGSQPNCSQLCVNAADCPKTHPLCISGMIYSPKKTQMMTFGICQVRAGQ